MPPLDFSRGSAGELQLPPAIETAVWRGHELAGAPGATLPTGFAALNAALPGGGWPCQGLSEVLAPQYTTFEWRLLAPALRQVGAAGQPVVVIGAGAVPFLAGLRQEGLNERQLIWVDVDTPAQRLWATEQFIKSKSFGFLMAWLPLVRADQIRRLQVLAAAGEAPVVLFRLDDAAHEASAAPLRLRGELGADWTLQLQVLKRKGAPLDQVLHLPCVPQALQGLMTPRLRFPSQWLAPGLPAWPSSLLDHAVVSPASALG